MSVILTYRGGGIGSNCYLFSDDERRNAVLIDPSASPETTAQAFEGYSGTIRAILITHAHADHLLSLRKWKEKTCAPVLIGKFDRYALSDPEANVAALLGLPDGDFGDADWGLEDGEEIRVGSETLTVLHTPGHTVGSVSYLSKTAVFTGDTVFRLGGVGRTDFFGGSEDALFDSVIRILSLPPELAVYPGHDAPTTIARERIYHNYHPV